MTQDTRKDRRVKIVSLNVRYKSATVDEFIENHAHDVSRGGIFIKTGNPFPPGTLLKFEIRLASDQAVIAGVGRIVWKRDAGASGERPAGMGVKFIKIDEPSKAVIDRLVNTKGDAGRSFETGDDAAEAPARSRTTPPSRPAAAATGSVSQRAVARSVTPAAGMAAAPNASTPQPKSPSTDALLARKTTIMGLGIAAPEGLAAPSPSASPPSPAGRASFSTQPSALPRPGVHAMFPAADDEDREMPAKEDQTVMRQAAELLEDALREAGGSMAEIGTNPLFSGSVPSPAESATTPETRPSSPVTPASEWTTADTPKALAATVAALRAEEAASHKSGEKRRSDAPRPARETPTSIRPASAVTIAKKNNAGTLVIVAVAAVFAIAGAVVFRDQLFGGGAPPEPVAGPPPPVAPTPAASAMASVTTVRIPPAQPATTTSAAAVAEKPSPTATQPSASATTSASPSAAPAAEPTFAQPMRAARPPPRRAPPPTGTDTTTAGTAPEATATGTVAKPAPPPKPKAEKPTDDNPY